MTESIVKSILPKQLADFNDSVKKLKPEINDTFTIKDMVALGLPSEYQFKIEKTQKLFLITYKNFQYWFFVGEGDITTKNENEILYKDLPDLVRNGIDIFNTLYQ